MTLLGRIIERTDSIAPPADWMIPGGPRDAIHGAAAALQLYYSSLLP